MANRARSGGFVVVGMVVVVATVMLIFIAGASAELSRRQANGLAAQQQVYLDDCAARIGDWYVRNLATVDAAVASPIPAAQILTASGITPRWNVQAAVSDQITVGNVRYRNIAVWIPVTTPDPSAMTAATGQFTPGPNVLFAMTMGQPIESEAMDRTLATMQTLAVALVQRFDVRVKADAGHDATINYFRTQDPGCVATLDEVPCIDTFASARGYSWDSIVGIPAATLVDGWGNDIQVSNLAGSNTAAPPFTMALQAVTPWGDVIPLSAIQPIQ